MRISSAHLALIVEHARIERPRECCGILIGTDDDILDVVPARNVAESSTRFQVDPKGHIDARRSARLRGLEVVGFYHSHPESAPEPSPTDVAEASYSGAVYLIVSLVAEPAEVRLFRLEDARFVETELSVSADTRLHS